MRRSIPGYTSIQAEPYTSMTFISEFSVFYQLLRKSFWCEITFQTWMLYQVIQRQFLFVVDLKWDRAFVFPTTEIPTIQ